MQNNVAIIGSGVTGLMFSKFLLDENIKFKIFEANSYYGGQWHYKNNPACLDVRENNSILPSAMYKCMRTNFPTDMMRFPDHPYPESTPDFPSHYEVMNYIRSYVEKNRLEEKIQYATPVNNVRKNKDSWVLTTSNSDELFNFVAVCTGRERTPYIPDLPGMSSFTGIVIHSNSYRVPESFNNKNVLVLGASYSGQEISTDLGNTAKHVYFCGRFEEDNHSCPKISHSYGQRNNITQHTCIESVNLNNVTLQNGEILNGIDVIILCTGYNYDFPFLGKDISKNIKISGKYVGPLYLDIFYPESPDLMFMGLPWGASHFYTVSLQSAFCSQFIAGKKLLPFRKEMVKQINTSLQELKNKGIETGEFLKYGKRQVEYHKLLCHLSGLEYNNFDKLRESLSLHKKRHKSLFRDQPFTYPQQNPNETSIY